MAEEAVASQPDFVLLGPSGFLGAAILRALQGAGHMVATSRVRLQDRPALEQLLDSQRPSIGVICAAGERGRPNISWCESHPVETLDANVTGQLNVAAACHVRNLHTVLLGTGALYSSTDPGRTFREEDPPNAKPNVYITLRMRLEERPQQGNVRTFQEELIAYFDNVLLLRVLYPVSSDLDPRGLLGKLARFERVDRVRTSVTVLEDLLPLLPRLARARARGVFHFANRGTLAYEEVVDQLAARAPAGWRAPVVDATSTMRAACELDTGRLAAACGCEIPEASSSVRRIIAALGEEDLRALTPSSPL